MKNRRRHQRNDDDDDFMVFPGLRSIVVMEEDPSDIEMPTGLLFADGSPIIRVIPTEKQGFIGFVCPSWALDLHMLREAEDNEEDDANSQ